MLQINSSSFPIEEHTPFELLDFKDEIFLEIFERTVNFENLSCQDLRTLYSLKNTCRRFKLILSYFPLRLTMNGPLSVEDFRCLRVAKGVYATFSKNFALGVDLRTVLDDILVFARFNTVVFSPEEDRSERWLQRDYSNLSNLLNSSFTEEEEKAELTEIFYELLQNVRGQEFSASNPFTLPKFCSNLIKFCDYGFNAAIQEELENEISSRNITHPLILSLFFRMCSKIPETNLKLLLNSERFRHINSPFLFELTAKIYNTRNDDSASGIYNEKALELNPDSVTALVKSLNYLNNEAGTDKALGNMNKALRRNPYYVEAWVGRGFIYSRLGAYDFALNDLTTALKLNPHHILCRGLRGELHYCMGNNDLAIEDLSIALNLDPKYTKARELRADIYSRTGNKNLAIADYDELLLQNPNHVAARKSRCELHFYKGNYSLALADIDFALQLNPNFIRARILRSAIYFHLKMDDQGIAEIEKAASIDPTHPSVLKAQMALRVMRRQNPNASVDDYALKNSDTNKRAGSAYESDPKRR